MPENIVDENRSIFQFGAFALDTHERLLLRDGKALALAPKAFDTLQLLVENAGHMLCKEELMRRVWQSSFVEENNLSQNISILRKLLDQQPGNEFIETIP